MVGAPSEAGRPRRRLVSIEDVVDALSSECDGAGARDGRGFSRADAQEGARLCALKRRGMLWSPEDARKATEITARYARQAGDILGGGRAERAQGIERSLRGGRVTCADPVDPAQPAYNYAALSPGGKRVYLWRTVPLADPGRFRRDLEGLSRMTHGRRRVQVDFDVPAEMTRNGRKLRARRSEADLNGTTRPILEELASSQGYVLDPLVGRLPEPLVDALRMTPRAVWVHAGRRDGVIGEWAVFDLDRRHDPFSTAVKRHAVDAASGRRLYTCDPRDDHNWWIVWDDRTRSLVRSLASHFEFAACPRISAPAP